MVQKWRICSTLSTYVDCLVPDLDPIEKGLWRDGTLTRLTGKSTTTKSPEPKLSDGNVRRAYFDPRT